MKVLIADDESIVLEGLKHIIDWENLGFTICSEARNGEETLEKILKLEPELVLLDIKMPKITGIEIVEMARERGFNGHFIILSGYSDFSYAQTAIRFGVDFYLTKPIDEEELEEAIIKVKQSIFEEKNNSTTLNQYREKARDTILHQLLMGDCNITSLNLGDLHLLCDVYQVVIYERYNQDSFHLSWNFAELLRVTNQDNNSFDHISLNEKEIILLKGSFALERFQNLLFHYRQGPQKGSPLDSLFISYGNPVYQLNQIPESYQIALKLIDRRFFCMPNQHVLGPDSLPEESQLTFKLNKDASNTYQKMFTNYIFCYNRSLLAESIGKLKVNLFFTYEDLDAIKHYLIDIYLQVKHNISHNYSYANIPFPTNADIIKYIENKYYLYEILQFMSDQFEMCMNAIGKPTSENIMDDILYYISHNYQQNLKLDTIAPLFGYNSSYLGKIFTKKTGESFNSYLDRIRIEHSKELLLSKPYKVYEIAEKVGYSNVDYFHKKFKKFTGISPVEFRKNNVP